MGKDGGKTFIVKFKKEICEYCFHTMARRKTKSLCSLLPGKRSLGGPPNRRADPFENAVGTILALKMARWKEK